MPILCKLQSDRGVYIGIFRKCQTKLAPATTNKINQRKKERDCFLSILLLHLTKREDDRKYIFISYLIVQQRTIYSVSFIKLYYILYHFSHSLSDATLCAGISWRPWQGMRMVCAGVRLAGT